MYTLHGSLEEGNTDCSEFDSYTSCTPVEVESSKLAQSPWQVHSVVHQDQILQGVGQKPR